MVASVHTSVHTSARAAALPPRLKKLYDLMTTDRRGMREIAAAAGLTYGCAKGYARDLYLHLGITTRDELLVDLVNEMRQEARESAAAANFLPNVDAIDIARVQALQRTLRKCMMLLNPEERIVVTEEELKKNDFLPDRLRVRKEVLADAQREAMEALNL